MSRVIFFMNYDKYEKREAPGILFFVQILLDKGHDVEFVASKDELFEKVGTKRYDSVCISMLSTNEIRETLKTAFKIKKADPHVVTILGGQGVTGLSDELIHAQGIDCVMEGEGEIILPILLDYLMRAQQSIALTRPFNEKAEIGVSKKTAEECGIDGINLLFKDRLFYLSPVSSDVASALSEMTFERKITENDEDIILDVLLSGFILKTTDEKIIRFDINREQLFERNAARYKEITGSNFPLSPIKLEEYSHSYPTNEELNGLSKAYPWEITLEKEWVSIGIYSQRGCNWMECTFCGIRTPLERRYEIPFIIKILKEAVKNGIKGVSFDDDQFIQNKKWVDGLLDEIIGAGLNKQLQFSAMLKVEAGRDKELIRKFKDAGFSKLQIGVESFLPEKVKFFYKSVRGHEEVYCMAAKEVIFNCLDAGIIPGAFIILTRPNEGAALKEITDELIEIADILFRAYQDFNVLPVISFNDLLMAYPNTPLIQQEGYKRFYAPLTPIEIIEKDKVLLDIKRVEIPYAYKLKNFGLTTFITELFSFTNKREDAPAVVCESIEHIDDAITALEGLVDKLGKEEFVAFAFIRELNKGSQFYNEKIVSDIIKNINFHLDKENQIDIETASERLKVILAKGELRFELIHRVVDKFGDENLKRLLIDMIPQDQLRERGTIVNNSLRIKEKMTMLKNRLDANVKRFFDKMKAEIDEILKMEGAERQLFYLNKKRDEIIIYSNNVKPYLKAAKALTKLIEWLDNIIEDLRKKHK